MKKKTLLLLALLGLAGTKAWAATPTWTPTLTSTQTATPSATQTQTLSFTRTITLTKTMTFTVSPTVSPTITPTYTFSPTKTVTPTVTPTGVLASFSYDNSRPGQVSIYWAGTNVGPTGAAPSLSYGASASYGSFLGGAYSAGTYVAVVPEGGPFHFAARVTNPQGRFVSADLIIPGTFTKTITPTFTPTLTFTITKTVTVTPTPSPTATPTRTRTPLPTPLPG